MSASVLAAVKLAASVCLWYFFNVQYNLVNKRVLNELPAHTAVAWIQLAIGVPIAAIVWATKICPIPSLSRDEYLKVVLPAFCFAAGQACTVASLAVVNVSLTHTVKALEPLVNAIVSAALLGKIFHPLVYVTLIPVVMGVALASVEDASYNTFGFITAMASNVFFALRNVMSAKYHFEGDMGEGTTTRKTNQLIVLTLLASFLWSPIGICAPGGLLVLKDAWKSTTAKHISSNTLLFDILQSGILFFMYQVSSFWVLALVEPITHSVLNSLKRVVVISAAVLFLQAGVTAKGTFGIAMALVSVLVYTFTKHYFSKKDNQNTAMCVNKGRLLAWLVPFVILGSMMFYFSVNAVTLSISGKVSVNSRDSVNASGSVNAVTQVKTLPSKIVTSMTSPPSSVKSTTAPSSSLLKGIPCRYSGKNIILFTAAGNGNWGDNMQPLTWVAHLSRAGIPLSSITSSTCSTCRACCYDWHDEFTRVQMPADNIEIKRLPFWNSDSVYWIGGGGLLGYPHQPLSLKADWQDHIITRGVRIVFAGVGSNPTPQAMLHAAEVLLMNASYLSARSTVDVKLISNYLNVDTVPLMPDPILADSLTYQFPREAVTKGESRNSTCWIFRSEDHEFLRRVAPLVEPHDVVYTMEGKDGNYRGILPVTTHFFNNGHIFFENIQNSCGLLVSQRYHGVILGLRALIPVVGLYEYAPHKVQQVMNLATEDRCSAATQSLTVESLSRLVVSCRTSFNRTARLERILRIQSVFDREFKNALHKSGVCL
eukprot:TRINITY_DN30038_c0_g1_i1.p1 TRINITY_DN30038_c0_g1~~TRINITY_DN30038_c0_g1_i1.p1  ORF type:complete len:767 (+),score=66.24 TRINITY_DN30038_c0_g1_i1:82-2382(+)